MTETLIVNGVVIANGVADSDGDILTKSDIKTINMKYQRDTDTMHTHIKNDGVEVFNSWISEVDTIIDGKVAPEGSWMVTMKVTNPQLIQCIEEGKLNGFSLGSVSEKAMTPKYWFINKSLNYRDIKNIEEIIPLYISFVDKPANQYGFEVMTYDAYINKKQKDVEEMTEANKDEMISISALERVKDLFGITKSETEVTVEKADEEVVTETAEPTADETVTALFEKLDKIIAQNEIIIEGMNKSEDEEEEVDEEEEIEKAEDEEESKKEEETSSEEETKEDDDEEKVEKEESEEEGETESETESEEEEDDVHVNKRETSMIENQTITESQGDFYTKTGRDSFGRKIKN